MNGRALLISALAVFSLATVAGAQAGGSVGSSM